MNDISWLIASNWANEIHEANSFKSTQTVINRTTINFHGNVNVFACACLEKYERHRWWRIFGNFWSKFFSEYFIFYVFNLIYSTHEIHLSYWDWRIFNWRRFLWKRFKINRLTLIQIEWNISWKLTVFWTYTSGIASENNNHYRKM